MTEATFAHYDRIAAAPRGSFVIGREAARALRQSEPRSDGEPE